MEEKEIVAKNLELYRKKAGYSQLELAKKLNYSNKNVSKWEKAETTPSVFVLNKIAKLYNIKVDDLLQEQQDIQNETIAKKSEKPILLGRKKTIFRLAMLALANALMFTAVTIAIYVLGLVDVKGFNMWLLYLYLTPLTILSIIIYIRVLYKYVSFILLSLFGWLICVSVYISLIHVQNIWLIFVLGGAYQLTITFITIIVDLKLSTKMQSILNKVFKHKNSNNENEQKQSQQKQSQETPNIGL